MKEKEPVYYGRNRDIIRNLDGFELLSDTDPFENDFSGDYLIARHRGKQGLLKKISDQEYHIIVHPEYESIRYCYEHSEAGRFGSIYLLHIATDQVKLYFRSRFFKGQKFVFDSIYTETNEDGLLIVSNDQKTGYLNLNELGMQPDIDVYYFPGDASQLNWETFKWIERDIAICNQAGKWGLFTYQWVKMVDFILESEPHYTRQGMYMLTLRRQYNKKQFFQEFGCPH